MWVSHLDPVGEGGDNDVCWADGYNLIRKELGFEHPGYILHEAVHWSEVHQQWFFIPRTASQDQYHEELDLSCGINLLIRTDEAHTAVQAVSIGERTHSRGFSCFQFIPGTDDTQILALKTQETYSGEVTTFYTVFTIDGEVLVPDTPFADIKFEGIEFM